MPDSGTIIGHSVVWVKHHPYLTAGAVFVGGAILVYLYYSGGTPAASAGGGGQSIDYLSAQLQSEVIQAQLGAKLGTIQAQEQAVAVQVQGAVAIDSSRNQTQLGIAGLQADVLLARNTSAQILDLAHTESARTLDLAHTESGRTLGLAQIGAAETVGLAQTEAQRAAQIAATDAALRLGLVQTDANLTLGLSQTEATRTIGLSQTEAGRTVGLAQVSAGSSRDSLLFDFMNRQTAAQLDAIHAGFAERLAEAQLAPPAAAPAPAPAAPQFSGGVFFDQATWNEIVFDVTHGRTAEARPLVDRGIVV
jgi:hypothetical protein